jgi:hypothetical protein
MRHTLAHSEIHGESTGSHVTRPHSREPHAERARHLLQVTVAGKFAIQLTVIERVIALIVSKRQAAKPVKTPLIDRLASIDKRSIRPD